jgi:ribonuclease-3
MRSWSRADLTVPADVGLLAERLQIELDDLSLLRKAMGHRSWCSENGGVESNERLEFLGDAVLGLVVTAHLYRTYPSFPEGELAKIRAAVVSTTSLAEIAQDIDLGAHLFLGKGEDQSGGRQKRSILADAVEAVIGAVYVDGGWDAAERLIMRLVGERLAFAAEGPGGQDFKTRLQEFAARRFDRVPRYEITDHGPDHEKRFVATVLVDGVARGSGEGPSKKQAEQAAAAMAWEAMEQIRVTEAEQQPLETIDDPDDPAPDA